MNKPRIGVIGLPGKWSTETLADAVASATGSRYVIDMSQVWLDLTHNTVHYQDLNLCEFDALIVKKISETYTPHTLDRLEILRICEHAGVRVCSPALNILRLIDRLSCTVTLRQHDIPMPATRICEDPALALQAVIDFGSAVFKPLYSTKARGMEMMHATEERSSLEKRIAVFHQAHPCMYIQQAVDLSGQDLGMVFLGGNYLGTYARVAQNDAWNTTIHSGGRYAAFEADQELIDLAHRAQAPFQMDFTTVDVALTDNGPIVFEVSAFGGFRGAKDGIGIDAASRYVDYVLHKIRE